MVKASLPFQPCSVPDGRWRPRVHQKTQLVLMHRARVQKIADRFLRQLCIVHCCLSPKDSKATGPAPAPAAAPSPAPAPLTVTPRSRVWMLADVGSGSWSRGRRRGTGAREVAVAGQEACGLPGQSYALPPRTSYS